MLVRIVMLVRIASKDDSNAGKDSNAVRIAGKDSNEIDKI